MKLARAAAMLSIAVAMNFVLGHSAAQECVSWDEIVAYTVGEDGGYKHYFKVVVCTVPGEPGEAIVVKVPIVIRICADDCPPAIPSAK